MTQKYELLRVTKTGSESLLRAFQNSPDVVTHGKQVKGHGVTLNDVPDGRIAIVSLRDPVKRFRSGYDMNYRDNHVNVRERYPTASLFAEALPEIMHDAEWGYTFRPQILWTGGAAEMFRRNVIWVMTEQIDAFITASAKHMQGVNEHQVHWNSQDNFGLPRSELTPVAIAAIMQAYAADYRMLEMLGAPKQLLTHNNGRI